MLADVQADENKHIFVDIPIKGVLRDEVLVRVFREPEHRGLIITSTIDRGYTQMGKVEMVGPKCRWVQKGDVVVLPSWGGRPAPAKEGRRALIKEGDVLAKVLG